MLVRRFSGVENRVLVVIEDDNVVGEVFKNRIKRVFG